MNEFPLKNIQEELEINHEKVDSIDEKINKLIEMQVNFKEKPRKNIEISSNIMNENSIKSHTKFKPLHLIKLCKSDADLNYCKINKESLRNFAKSFREFKNEYNILKQETNERLWEGIQKIDNLRTHLNNIYNLSNNLNRFKEFSNKIYEKDELPVKIINIESNKSIEEDLINFQQESNKNLEIVGDELINQDKNNNIMNQRQKLDQHFEYPIKKPLLNFFDDELKFNSINIVPRSNNNCLQSKLISSENNITDQQKFLNQNKLYTFNTFDINQIFEGSNSKPVFNIKGIESSLDNIQLYQENFRPSNCTIEAQTEDNFSLDPELMKNEEKLMQHKNKNQERNLETGMGILNNDIYKDNFNLFSISSEEMKNE